jgi:hypothetical protein
VRPLRQAATVETENALRLVRGEGQSLHADATR